MTTAKMFYHCKRSVEDQVALCESGTHTVMPPGTWDLPHHFINCNSWAQNEVYCQVCLAHPDLPMLVLKSIADDVIR
jgi:hypothetical protein